MCRIISTNGQACTKRFIDSLELFFIAAEKQAADRTAGVIPDLKSYIALRRDTSGCKPTFALIEYAAGIDLPDKVASDPVVKALEEAANDLIAWSNVGRHLHYFMFIDLHRHFGTGYLLVQC
jgi:Terpene synthase family 2, C-terminal metal binding